MHTEEDTSIIMQAKMNRFRDIEIKSTTLPHDTDRFRKELRHLLERWRSENIQAVWLKIPQNRVELVPIAQKEFHFQCHHVNLHHYMMTLWLKDSPSKLPPCGTHNVGVSVLLYRQDTKEILLVKEKYYNQRRQWKLISGSSELGEFLHECVQREVYEETGMRCKFKGLLGFWNRKNIKYGKSELHFCAYAELLPSYYQRPLRIQEDEIYSARWFTLSEIKKMELDQQFVEKQWFSQFYEMQKRGETLHSLETRDFRKDHSMFYHLCHEAVDAKE